MATLRNISPTRLNFLIIFSQKKNYFSFADYEKSFDIYLHYTKYNIMFVKVKHFYADIASIIMFYNGNFSEHF